MKCVLNKYIVENTMGDNKYFINVKFVYNYYLFGKLVKTETKIDPIVFSKKDDAERYAKYVVKPSKKINGVYIRKSITNINNGSIYKVFTEIDNDLVKVSSQLADLDKSFANKVYEVFYIIGDDYYVHYDYRNAPSFTSTHFRDFMITNKIIYENDTIHLEDDDVYYNKDLTIAYKIFKDHFNYKIKSILETERKERLSKTLIDSTETLVKNEALDKSSIDSSINVPFDEARNELIKQELKRVNEYKNFLTKLLK